jgi:hypothetical protein
MNITLPRKTIYRSCLVVLFAVGASVWSKRATVMLKCRTTLLIGHSRAAISRSLMCRIHSRALAAAWCRVCRQCKKCPLISRCNETARYQIHKVTSCISGGVSQFCMNSVFILRIQDLWSKHLRWRWKSGCPKTSFLILWNNRHFIPPQYYSPSFRSSLSRDVTQLKLTVSFRRFRDNLSVPSSRVN